MPSVPVLWPCSAEFSPDVGGPQVMARSNILPYPSTIAGALATLVLEDKPNLIPVPNLSKWAEEMSKILGGVKLRGPYLICDEEVFVQVNMESFVKIVDPSFISSERILKPKFVNTFGIKMDDRRRTVSQQTPDKSMIYSAQMVAYDGHDVYIGIDIDNCSPRLEDVLSRKKILRLGGEGRLVAISVSDKPRLHDDHGNYLFIISPALFETTNNSAQKAVNYNEILLEIEKKHGIRPILEKASFGIIGGFSTTQLRRRKPIYAAIMPGSILKVDTEKEALRLVDEGFGLFSDLGFGSAIRIEKANV